MGENKAMIRKMMGDDLAKQMSDIFPKQQSMILDDAKMAISINEPDLA